MSSSRGIGRLSHDNTTGDETTVLGEEGTEDEGADSGELDEDVDGGTRGVLEGITDGVTSDSGSVGGVTLPNSDHLPIRSLDLEHTSLDVLLGVIPSTTRVGGGESNLDTRNNAASKNSVSGLVAEQDSTKKRRDDNKETWGNHLFEGGVSRDGDASLEVWLSFLGASLSSVHSLELILDFTEHLLSSITDSLHGHGGEPVWEHGTNEETSESERLKDVDLVSIGSLCGLIFNVVHLSDAVGDTSDEGTEEGKSDEAGRSDSETLSDGSGGVTSGIKVISSLTNSFIEVGHLSNTASIVRNGAISINRESNGEAAEHANGSESDTIHSSEMEGNKNGDSETEDGDDAGEVSEGETVDDIGGSTVFAGFSELTGRGVLLGSVVLSDKSDEETGPETEDNADVALPLGCVVWLASECDSDTFFGEHEDSGDNHDGHKDSGYPQLNLELIVDVLHLDVSQELADEGGANTNSSDNEREVDGLRSGNHGL